MGRVENLIKDLACDLSIGSITKEEFDTKYKRIIEKNVVKEYKFEYLFIKKRDFIHVIII